MTTSGDPYASRGGCREEIAARTDPVIWGEAAGALDDQQRASYEEKGFLQFEQMFGVTEVRHLRAAADRLVRELPAGIETVVCEPDSDVKRSIFRPHHHDRHFAALVEDSRLRGMAEEILGGKVYLHQCRINIKPAVDGRDFSWHSDFETWHCEDGMPRIRALSCSLMLHDNDETNGPLLVIPGSHHRFVRCAGATPRDHYRSSLRNQEYGVPSAHALRELSAGVGIVSCRGPAGSVVLFDANLMHASGGNMSPHPRSNVFIVYNSVENRLRRPYASPTRRPAFLAENAPPR